MTNPIYTTEWCKDAEILGHYSLRPKYKTKNLTQATQSQHLLAVRKLECLSKW